MRIAVMGTGGVGGYFGGLLARAGEDVTFTARGEHLKAIQAHGLTVKSSQHGDFTLPVRATAQPSEIGTVDLLLFCVKTYDLESAAEQIRPLVGPSTIVLPIQNGIDSVERIARVVGAEPVIGGVARVLSVVEAPGVIGHRLGGQVVFGEYPEGTSVRTERLLDMFVRAGITAELHSNIRVALWEKYVVTCAGAGMTALTRLPLGLIREYRETSELFRGVMAEVHAVGRALGVPLADDLVENLWTLVQGMDGSFRGALYHDLAAGRRMEVETYQGTVVRLGRELGVATTLNFAIYAVLKPHANGAPAVPAQS